MGREPLWWVQLKQIEILGSIGSGSQLKVPPRLCFQTDTTWLYPVDFNLDSDTGLPRVLGTAQKGAHIASCFI